MAFQRTYLTNRFLSHSWSHFLCPSLSLGLVKICLLAYSNTTSILLKSDLIPDFVLTFQTHSQIDSQYAQLERGQEYETKINEPPSKVGM